MGKHLKSTTLRDRVRGIGKWLFSLQLRSPPGSPISYILVPPRPMNVYMKVA